MAAQEAVVTAGVEGGAANGTNSPAGQKKKKVRRYSNETTTGSQREELWMDEQ